MTKKISVWLAAVLLIFAVVITFELTVIFGGAFVREEPVGEVPTEYTTAEPEPEPDPVPPTLSEEIMARVSEKIGALAALYEQYYVGELNIDELVEGAAEGFVAYAGDKYGAYHTAEEYAELMTDYAGEFAGIGVSVVYNAEYGAIEILNVMPNSPALEADLRPNDLIIGVGGEDVLSLGYNEAVNRIRGEIDTDVTLRVARGETYADVFELTLTRRKVEEQTVTYETMKVDGVYAPIAYIRLMSFDHKTAAQFAEALSMGQAERVHGYIIDVRNNGGGELNAIIDVLDMLLPEGPIVRIQYKDGTETVHESDAKMLNEPIVVLANGNTASAAELFVAALRDYNKGIIVGETTYGKGTVQSIISFTDGTALRISTAMYLPPFTENFEGKGVEPHVAASLADEYKNVNLFKLPYDKDEQLQAAIKLYK